MCSHIGVRDQYIPENNGYDIRLDHFGETSSKVGVLMKLHIARSNYPYDIKPVMPQSLQFSFADYPTCSRVRSSVCLKRNSKQSVMISGIVSCVDRYNIYAPIQAVIT